MHGQQNITICKQLGLSVSKHIPLYFKYKSRSDNKFTSHIFRVLDFHFYPTMLRTVPDTLAPFTITRQELYFSIST